MTDTGKRSANLRPCLPGVALAGSTHTLAAVYRATMWRQARPARSRRSAPGFIAPCIPTLAKVAPSGPIWVHEIKHDGYRIIARKDRERVRLWSRHGLSWTEAFPLIVEGIRALPADCAILDGEAVLECEDARHDFHGLRTAAAKNACLFAFDLLAVK